MDNLLNNEINKYKKKFEELIKIKVGDKPYYENKKIELSKNSIIPFYQNITRTIYFLNRNDFLKKFTKDVNNISKLYYLINEFDTIIFTNLDFNKKIFIKIKGLINQLFFIIETLKITYKKDGEFVKKLINLQNIIPYKYY